MGTSDPEIYDILIIGGGINGAGIARDAASRGLRVLLCEQNDLGSATSSASSKLIHGGLRYLEHYEFKLVREALSERETLMRVARHLVKPMRFVLPHIAAMRPAWMIRIGLFLYDHLSRSNSLPRSRAIDLGGEWGRGLKPEFTRGFVYSDCWVDDARLVLANALAARDDGADVRVRCKVQSATYRDGRWIVTTQDTNTAETGTYGARVIVNAAGPWVSHVQDTIDAAQSQTRVRLVKGSHIVVPRPHNGDHAYILQHDDRRVVFMIPFEDRYSVIGTTDVPISSPHDPVSISDDEVDYLCTAVSRYTSQPVTRADVVWDYAGVRPLFDDGQQDPSKVTRDYVLESVTTPAGGPVLSVYGGKVTTYRHLAESAVERLRPYFTMWRQSRTAELTLPGSDFPGIDLLDYHAELKKRFIWLPQESLLAMLRRHGSGVEALLDDATCTEDLGIDFGCSLYQREVDLFIDREWAQTSDDILWRRTKCGLHMTASEKSKIEEYIRQRIARIQS
ncbi:MAG: glycerol-3-phosphate dehydrogenase [Gammaproteobacteria bacterium]|nr:glycerol-3-phosphate dehydrogenase [Gammaproteobacteria bacterium]